MNSSKPRQGNEEEARPQRARYDAIARSEIAVSSAVARDSAAHKSLPVFSDVGGCVKMPRRKPLA
jgi:hypothetical protein